MITASRTEPSDGAFKALDATPLLLLRLLAFKRNETESFWFLLLSGVESSSSDLVPVTTVTRHVGDVLHFSEWRVYSGEGACSKHLWSSPLCEYFTCSSDPYWTSLKCLVRTQHFLLRWDGSTEHKFGQVMGLPITNYHPTYIVYMSGVWWPPASPLNKMCIPPPEEQSIFCSQW